MTPIRRLFHCLFGCIIAYLMWHWGLFHPADNLIYDTFMRWGPGEKPDARIQVVAIDDESVRQLGNWPWPRSVHARMIETLHQAGASVVVYNVMFPEPGPRRDGNLALEHAVRRHGRVLLPVYPDARTEVMGPYAGLASVAAGLVDNRLGVSTDGVSRHMAVGIRTKDAYFPPLAEEAVRLFEGRQAPIRRSTVQARRGIFFLPAYYNHPALRFADVLADPPDLRGKIVLVGVTATGLADTLSTPLLPGKSTPSVQVQANLIDNLLHRRVVWEANWPSIVFSLLFVLLGISAVLMIGKRIWLQWGGTLIVLSAEVGILYLIFASAHWKGSPMALATASLLPLLTYFIDTVQLSNEALRREVVALAKNYPGPKTLSDEAQLEHSLETLVQVTQASFAIYRQRHDDRLDLLLASRDCPKELFNTSLPDDLLALGGRVLRWDEVPLNLRPALVDVHYLLIWPHMVGERAVGNWEFYFQEAPPSQIVQVPAQLLPHLGASPLTQEHWELGTSEDTTTLIHLLARLGQQINRDREFYEAVLLSTHTGLIVCDAWGTILFHNPQLLKDLSPDSTGSLQALNLLTVINRAFVDSAPQWSTLWPQVVHDRQGVQIQLARDPIYMSLTLTPVLDKSESQVIAVVGALVDQTVLKKQALTDALTGLHNRRSLEDTLRVEFLKARRIPHYSYSVLLLDLDNFKRINDQFGHAAGDQVLREVAALLLTTVRKSDFVARYGGEELVLLLPGTAMDGAFLLAEKIRRLLSQLPIKAIQFPKHRVTVSVGIGMWEPGDQHPEDALRRADKALYASKEKGKNRTYLYSSEKGIYSPSDV